MKVTIPTTLSDVTLNQYLHFRKLIREYPDAGDDFVKLSAVTIFCNLSIEQARSIDHADYEQIAADLVKLLQEKPKFVQRFTHNGVEYGFIPNLDKMTAGEYIDLDTYLSDEATYYEAMAVMFRPITHKFKDLYQIEDYEGAAKYKQALATMPLGVALGALVFFWTLNGELLRATRTYLQQIDLSTLLPEADLTKSGDGMQASILLLEAAELHLKTLLPSTSIAS